VAQRVADLGRPQPRPSVINSSRNCAAASARRSVRSSNSITSSASSRIIERLLDTVASAKRVSLNELQHLPIHDRPLRLHQVQHQRLAEASLRLCEHAAANGSARISLPRGGIGIRLPTHNLISALYFIKKKLQELADSQSGCKGATPAFPGQRGFVGGSMGDDAVIVEGVDGPAARAALYSTQRARLEIPMKKIIPDALLNPSRCLTNR
jgi:hypothetical protein